MKRLMHVVFFLAIISISFAQDLNSAKNLLQNNKLNEAKSTLDKLISKDKNNTEAHFYLVALQKSSSTIWQNIHETGHVTQKVELMS